MSQSMSSDAGVGDASSVLQSVQYRRLEFLLNVSMSYSMSSDAGVGDAVLSPAERPVPPARVPAQCLNVLLHVFRCWSR